MIETDTGLRELLHASVAEVRAPESLRHLVPAGRPRLRVRHSVLVVVPLVAILAAGAAVAVVTLRANESGMPRLFIRTTDDGVRIRAYTGVGIPSTVLDGGALHESRGGPRWRCTGACRAVQRASFGCHCFRHRRP